MWRGARGVYPPGLANTVDTRPLYSVLLKYNQSYTVFGRIAWGSRCVATCCYTMTPSSRRRHLRSTSWSVSAFVSFPCLPCAPGPALVRVPRGNSQAAARAGGHYRHSHRREGQLHTFVSCVKILCSGCGRLCIHRVLGHATATATAVDESPGAVAHVCRTLVARG